MSEINVTFLPLNKTIKAQTGERLIDKALEAGIDMQMACGGNAACSTCRMIIKEGKLSEKEEMEALWGLPEGERLSCQCLIQDTDIVAEIPE